MLENFFINSINKDEIIKKLEKKDPVCIFRTKESDENCLSDWIPQYEVKNVISSTTSTMAIHLIGHF